MTLKDAKKQVLEKEDQRIDGMMKIFYPDPCNEDDCAQCGKSKEQHEADSSGKPFFCSSMDERKRRPYEELMDEAAELYAKTTVDGIRESYENSDIKYMGIPNICFSLTNKGDKREENFRKQRFEFGFDDSETWSLRDTIARFIIPRIERYEEIANNVLIREDELKKDIDTFISAMKLMVRDDGICTFTDEENEIIDKGLNAFPKIFFSLWW
ncbi:MAG: hypothetical protein AABY15_03015 [Nanoarchaeota archaeon]